MAAIRQGWNVAVVFRNVPEKYLLTAQDDGLEYAEYMPVVSGDQDDLRFLDPRGVIVGLTPKGKAKQDTSGFVR